MLVTRGYLAVDGKMFHIRCLSHIINLVVHEGTDIIKDMITKVHDSAKYVKSSTLRLQTFKEVASQVKAPKKSLVLDVPTRWNSTFFMLQTTLEFKMAFYRLADVDSSYKHAPDEEEWKTAKIVCDILRNFYNVTNIFSSTLYTSANYFFPHICALYVLLNDLCGSHVPFISAMSVKMKVKFDKYWDASNIFLSIASVLDPRHKMDTLEFYMKKIYGS